MKILQSLQNRTQTEKTWQNFTTLFTRLYITLQNFYRVVQTCSKTQIQLSHNSYTTLQNYTLPYISPHNFRLFPELYKILYTLLQNFAQLYNIFNIAHNSTTTETFHNYTKLYNTLHNSSFVHKFIQDSTRTLDNFYNKSLQHISQFYNTFTQLYTTIQN